LFRGEKSALFWIGLIILAFASIILFTLLWQFAFIELNHYVTWNDVKWMIRSSVPLMVGAVVFILIGLYMMKSGVKNIISNQK
jgi:hypothetical protein